MLPTRLELREELAPLLLLLLLLLLSLLGLLLKLLFEALLRLLSLPKSFALSLLLLNLPNEGLFEPEFERVRALFWTSL